MARRPFNSLFCVILACTGLPAGALAAELGDARVASHIGQQLVADIELTALQDEATPVQVRLASADIYRGAGIVMPPVLAGLNLSVTRRGGRQFVHVTSQGAVQSEYLHLYLELGEGSERAVRLATLWLTPNPNPAPPAVAQPVLQVAAEPQPGPKVAPQAELKAVPKVEAKPTPEPKPVPKPEPALKPERVSKLEPGSKPEPVSKPAPALKPEPASKPEPAPVPKPALKPVPAPRARPIPAPEPVAKAGPLAAPASPLAGAAAPASCPQPDPAVLKTCVALDYKNTQLTAKIGHLEDKVKVLQLAMGATRAETIAPPPSAPRLVPFVAKPKKAPPPAEPDFPWLWVALSGAVLLAGAGAAVVMVRRRKAEQERKAQALKASLPPIMGGVKNRLMPDKRADDGVEATADSAQE